MPDYTLKDVQQAERYTTTNGNFQAWAVLVEHHDGITGDVVAQLSTKIAGDGTTRTPEEGETIDATLSSGPKGWRLKKNWKPAESSQGRSGGNWTPKKEKEVTHLSNLKVAVHFMQIRALLKEIDHVVIQDVINIANILDEDVAKLQ